MTFKKWALSFLGVVLAVLTLLGAVTVIIDPYFHYHAPLDCLQYRIFYQRYQNDGIVKHFDYDALITGNSMVENFKASEADALFGINSVKVPFSGATGKELDSLIRTAVEYNDKLRIVISDIDYENLVSDKDYLAYDEKDYPTFLYDKNIFNDVKYLFNKSIFKTSLDVISYTLGGNTTTSFDDYSFWDTIGADAYSQEAVLGFYHRADSIQPALHLNEERLALVRGNIGQNIIETAQANPQIEFYYYIPPVNMYTWDNLQREGTLELHLEAEKVAIEMMLECDNIHLFSFMDAYDLVQDFSRYKDTVHHDSGVNSWILECMAAGEHMLTRDNYMDYWNGIYEFYTTYDYDSLFPAD